MISHEIDLRVRYADTDRMGYVYYGNYATYFEVGRAELIRSLGFTYKELEDRHGIILPVVNLQVQYKRPALYDDLLIIQTQIRELPGARIKFNHQVLSAGREVLVTGTVELVFVKQSLMRPTKAPEAFLDVLLAHWEAEPEEAPQLVQPQISATAHTKPVPVLV